MRPTCTPSRRLYCTYAAPMVPAKPCTSTCRAAPRCGLTHHVHAPVRFYRPRPHTGAVFTDHVHTPARVYAPPQRLHAVTCKGPAGSGPGRERRTCTGAGASENTSFRAELVYLRGEGRDLSG
jgi:hypothetical protein